MIPVHFRLFNTSSTLCEISLYPFQGFLMYTQGYCVSTRFWSLIHESNIFFFMTVNLSSSSSRRWICLHLPDSPFSSGECSHSGGGWNPASPGLFIQPQETLSGSDGRHGTNRRGSAQDRSQPQHAEQQGQVGHRARSLWTLLDTKGGQLLCKVRWCFSFVFCCF